MTVRNWNCADKYTLIDLSELIVFCYDLGDTQDGLVLSFVVTNCEFVTFPLVS